ncbi:MAG TPA: winged helix-turn-helix transcriptional regulator [Thermoplasmata archaeon]|nr:winged helix-turn-helix transcriptional regulator [Thermoplasmata archaeon]
MDATDYSIYRYLSPDGLARFWASRRVIDPRVTARAIAERVGLSEAGVRARLRVLESQRLIGANEVHLNPSLFGLGTYVVEIPIEDPRASESLLHDLTMLEGVVFARDVLDERARKLTVYLAAETPEALPRRVALLRRLRPGLEVPAPRPYWLPECTRPLTPADWRVLWAVLRAPDATLAEIASAARLSGKTAARRYSALLDDRACWWTPADRAEEWPLALLELGLAPGYDRSAIAAEVERQSPSWLPVAADGRGVDPGADASIVAGLVPAETPAGLERIVQRLGGLDGVASLRRTFGLRSAYFPQWATDRLAARSGP